MRISNLLTFFVFSLLLNSCVEKSTQSNIERFKVSSFVNLISTFYYKSISPDNITEQGLIQGIGMNTIPLFKFKTIKKTGLKIFCLSYKLPYVSSERERYGILKLYQISKDKLCVDGFNNVQLAFIDNIASLRIFLDYKNVLRLEVSILGEENVYKFSTPLLNVKGSSNLKRFSTGVSNRMNAGLMYITP